jgi:hypothetical protein
LALIQWILLGFFFLLIMFGLKDGIKAFIGIWFSDGFLFAGLVAVFFILFITPSLVKEFAPSYYGLAIWALILYSVGLVSYRFLKRGS